MSFSAIWAEGANGEFGNNNELPWGLSKPDMAWFRKHTMDKPIVMGYRTWKSLGCKCLPGRTNIILSNEAIFGMEHLNMLESPDKPYWVCSLDMVTELLGETEIMLIGGAKTYQEHAGKISRVYRTVFLHNYNHDVAITSNTDDMDLVYYDGFSEPDILFSIHEVVDEPLVIELGKV